MCRYIVYTYIIYTHIVYTHIVYTYIVYRTLYMLCIDISSTSQSYHMADRKLENEKDELVCYSNSSGINGNKNIKMCSEKFYTKEF